MVLYEYRHERTAEGLSYCTRRVLGAEAYHLLQQRTRQDSATGATVELLKRSICFTWQGRYYELNSYAKADRTPLPKDFVFSGCQIFDYPTGAPVPEWLDLTQTA